MITTRRGSLRVCSGFNNDPRQSNALPALTMAHVAEGCRGFFQILTHMRTRAHVRATSRDPQQPSATMAMATATCAGCAACSCRGSVVRGAQSGRPEAWLEQVRRKKHRLCDQPAPASKIIAERADVLQWAHALAAKATALGLMRALKRGCGLHRLTTKSLFHGSFLGLSLIHI